MTLKTVMLCPLALSPYDSPMSLQRIESHLLFDTQARITHLNELRDELALSPIPQPAVISDVAERPTIGAEVEMTWVQAFRNMQGRWLNSEVRPRDHDIDSYTHREFALQYKRNNTRLAPILKSITPVIPRVGFDSYWEFSFRPVKDTRVSDAELTTLYEAGILFEDIPCATHMTIANIPSERDAAAILCLVEQAGGTTPKRLESARTSMKGSWARKGTGSMRLRAASELEGTHTSAYEFRTLVATSPEQMNRLMKLGQEMAYVSIHNTRKWKQIRAKVEDSLVAQGLPLKQWGPPKDTPEIWKKYGETLLTASQQ